MTVAPRGSRPSGTGVHRAEIAFAAREVPREEHRLVFAREHAVTHSGFGTDRLSEEVARAEFRAQRALVAAGFRDPVRVVVGPEPAVHRHAVVIGREGRSGRPSAWRRQLSDPLRAAPIIRPPERTTYSGAVIRKCAEHLRKRNSHRHPDRGRLRDRPGHSNELLDDGRADADVIERLDVLHDAADRDREGARAGPLSPSSCR